MYVEKYVDVKLLKFKELMVESEGVIYVGDIDIRVDLLEGGEVLVEVEVYIDVE